LSRPKNTGLNAFDWGDRNSVLKALYGDFLVIGGREIVNVDDRGILMFVERIVTPP